MKLNRCKLLILFLLIYNFTFGTKVINGIVSCDLDTNVGIGFSSVLIQTITGKKDTILTDKNGFFSLELENNDSVVLFSAFVDKVGGNKYYKSEKVIIALNCDSNDNLFIRIPLSNVKKNRDDTFTFFFEKKSLIPNDSIQITNICEILTRNFKHNDGYKFYIVGYLQDNEKKSYLLNLKRCKLIKEKLINCGLPNNKVKINRIPQSNKKDVVMEEFCETYRAIKLNNDLSKIKIVVKRN